ncbi:MAG: WbqC family protein [Flavobacteriaceae bacterium]
MSLIYPSYFPNIANYIVFHHSRKICFEVQDHYQKQTFRNRCYIYGSNGLMGLHIPVHYTQKKRQKTSDIIIDNSSPWKVNHWKSLESAYRTSPFFEFYEDDLRPLFENKDDVLLPFLYKCMNAINLCIDLDLCYIESNTFEKNHPEDFRFLINARSKNEIKTTPYIQVFQNKFGYLNNLSILDLLFNLGPDTLRYLEAHPPIEPTI